MYESIFALLMFIVVIVVLVLLLKYNKKNNVESIRKSLLNEYSNYKDLIEDFNKSYQSLQVAPVDKVNYTLQIVNVKYELMLPLVSYKESINNWYGVIKDLKSLNNKYISHNVSIILKRFELLEKYGEDVGNRLANHNYFAGMTEQMLIDAKGEPLKVDRTGVIDSKTVYTYKTNSSEEVFTFINGELHL